MPGAANLSIRAYLLAVATIDGQCRALLWKAAGPRVNKPNHFHQGAGLRLPADTWPSKPHTKQAQTVPKATREGPIIGSATTG